MKLYVLLHLVSNEQFKVIMEKFSVKVNTWLFCTATIQEWHLFNWAWIRKPLALRKPVDFCSYWCMLPSIAGSAWRHFHPSSWRSESFCMWMLAAQMIRRSTKVGWLQMLMKEHYISSCLWRCGYNLSERYYRFSSWLCCTIMSSSVAVSLRSNSARMSSSVAQ